MAEGVVFALAAGGFAASSSTCAKLAFSPDAVERILCIYVEDYCFTVKRCMHPIARSAGRSCPYHVLEVRPVFAPSPILSVRRNVGQTIWL